MKFAFHINILKNCEVNLFDANQKYKYTSYRPKSLSLSKSSSAENLEMAVWSALNLVRLDCFCREGFDELAEK